MNSKIFSTLFLLLFVTSLSFGQTKYLTRTAHVYVQSSNSVVDIEADNYQVISSLNPQTGDISFTGLLKSFEFKLGAADQVFNSKSVDVSTHPKIEFKGKVADISKINFAKPGNYKLKVKGMLHLWGLVRETSADGSITVEADGSIKATSDFVMVIEEASVKKINQLMKEKLPAANVNTETLGISKKINVKLDMSYRAR